MPYLVPDEYMQLGCLRTQLIVPKKNVAKGVRFVSLKYTYIFVIDYNSDK
jgi:hypothetical protein